MGTTILNKPEEPVSSGPDIACAGSQDVAVEVVVISLSSASERRRKTCAMLDGVPLKWSFFDAHRSLDHPGLTYDPERIKKRFGRQLSTPEIAVCSSHVAVLTEFLRRDAVEYILVLEDDVIYDIDFPINDFCAFCSKKGIDYIRLFGKHYAEAVHLGFYFDRSILRYKSSPAGAQAYLMSRNGARQFLASYRSIDATVDLAMDSFWQLPLPIYSIFPYPIIERYSPTSIPMAAYTGELRSSERLVWNFNRAITKARKILANFLLRSDDRRMKSEADRFSQIFDDQRK